MTQTAPRRLQVGKVGELVARVDAPPKVTGEFAYASDLIVPGMLWGHTLRSPHAHARIRSIDITEAVTMAGVHAVLTHDDVPGLKTYGLEFSDQPVLAIDRVLYHGEPVALVAAEHPEQARRAAERIIVDYEPLEPVADMERATEHVDLHPEKPTRGHGYREDDRPNVVRHMVIRHGDPDTAGDVSVEGVYEVGIQDQAFLGPESGLAVPDGEGGVDIYVATQWLHVDRAQVAPCLGLELAQVRIHLAGVGGAFGGREDLSMQVHGALLALHTGRPVKIVYNREESFTGHVHRHPAKIWCEHRASRAGKLVCVRMRILLDRVSSPSKSAAGAASRSAAAKSWPGGAACRRAVQITTVKGSPGNCRGGAGSSPAMRHQSTSASAKPSRRWACSSRRYSSGCGAKSTSTRMPFGPQYPRRLGDRGRRAVGVMQHLMNDDGVEGAVGERQLVHVPQPHLPFSSPARSRLTRATDNISRDWSMPSARSTRGAKISSMRPVPVPISRRSRGSAAAMISTSACLDLALVDMERADAVPCAAIVAKIGAGEVRALPLDRTQPLQIERDRSDLLPRTPPRAGAPGRSAGPDRLKR